MQTKPCSQLYSNSGKYRKHFATRCTQHKHAHRVRTRPADRSVSFRGVCQRRHGTGLLNQRGINQRSNLGAGKTFAPGGQRRFGLAMWSHSIKEHCEDREHNLGESQAVYREASLYCQCKCRWQCRCKFQRQLPLHVSVNAAPTVNAIARQCQCHCHPKTQETDVDCQCQCHCQCRCTCHCQQAMPMSLALPMSKFVNALE